MKVSIGGVLKDVASIKVRIGSAWKAATNTRAVVGGAWKAGETFTGGSGGGGGGGGFGLTASPSYVDGFSGASPVTTSASTAIPTGGVAPFTYSWVLVSGSAVANSPTSATTTFSAYGVAPGGSESCTFRCTVTDAIGSFATVDCAAEFFRS